MPNPIDNAGIFLINTLFDLYIFILIIRLVLVKVRANYFNPFSQFIIKFTQPIINPLRRFIPNIAHIELASLVVILTLTVIKFYLIGFIMTGIPHFSGVVILAIADTLKSLLNIFFYAILLQAILSWVQPNSPLNSVLNLITGPIIRPIQKIIPTVSGFDISPIFALVGLQLLMILLITPLLNIALTMSY